MATKQSATLCALLVSEEQQYIWEIRTLFESAREMTKRALDAHAAGEDIEARAYLNQKRLT